MRPPNPIPVALLAWCLCLVVRSAPPSSRSTHEAAVGVEPTVSAPGMASAYRGGRGGDGPSVTATGSAVEDPGTPADPHTPFLLPFRAADVVFQSGSSFAWVADTNSQRVVRVDVRSGLADRQYPLGKWPLRLALAPDGETLLAALSPTARLLRTGYVAEFHLPSAVKRREFPIDTGINRLLVGPGDLFVGGIEQGDMTVYRLGEAKRLDSRAGGILGFARSPSSTNFYLFGASGVSRWGIHPASGKLNPEGVFANAGLVGDDLFLLPGETNALSAAGRVLASAPLGPVAKDLALVHVVHTGRVERVAFDVPRRAMFLLATATQTPPYRTNLYHYHLDSRLLLGTYAVTNGSRHLGADPDWVYVAAIRTNGTFFQRLPNPAAGSESNQPPTARFEFGPADATTLVPVTFDASGSIDAEDGATGLLYRWDWDGDGTFETEFGARATNAHRFNLAGTHRVTLEVRDRVGSSARLSREVVVRVVDDPGQEPADAPTPFVLPFAPGAIVFDPARPRLFGVDPAGRRLVRMDLGTGLIDRVYAFDHYPDSLAIGADGRSLAVTTLLRPDYTTPTGPWRGFVAHFDLERDVKTHEFGLETVPRSLSLTTGGVAIVGGGGSSTPASGVHVYRVATGERVHRGPPFEATRSTVHPDQSRFYAVTIGSSSHTAYRFDILADGAVTNRGGFGGEWMGDGIEMLSRDRLVSNRGGVFSSSADPGDDGRFLGGLDANILDVAPDPARRVFFAAGTTWSGQPFVRLHHASTLQAGWELVAPPVHPRHVHAASDMLYWVSVEAGSATVGRAPNPAIGGESNQAPTARFETHPGIPVAGRETRFDAGGSTDDGPTAALRYRWDWDGDGIFDTPPLSEPGVTRTFELGGTRTVGLQVLDAYGATNLVARSFEIGPGPGTETTDFESVFPATSVRFHPFRPLAYALDPVGRRLVRVDLATGLTAGELPLGYPRASMALTPDATTLVVAVRRRISGDSEGEGTLLVLDPETLAIRNSFEVAMDPEDLVATDAGLVVATSGSGQWTKVRSFRWETGAELGSAQVYYHGLLALHPSQRAFYVSTTALNPPSTTRFDLDPATGVIGVRGTTGDTQGDLFPAPTGEALISQSGVLLRASDDPAQDLQFLRRITEAEFADVDFDPASGRTFAVGSYWAVSPPVRLFVLGSDYEMLEARVVPGTTRYVHSTPPYLYTVEIETNRTIFRRRSPPGSSLALTARAAAGAGGTVEIEIETAGPPGRDFVLWRSETLSTWSPVSTNRLEEGVHRYRPPGAGFGAVFYRAALVGN